MFKSVWLHPRLTARRMIEEKNRLSAILLVLFGSVASGIISADSFSGMDTSKRVGIFIAAIIGTVILGIVLYYLVAWVLKIVGGWFGGIGSFNDIFQAYSIVYILQIYLLPIYLIWAIAEPGSTNNPQTMGTVGVISTIIISVVSIWSFVVAIASVAEAHQFSYWKAFFTIIIPCIIFTMAFLVIFLIIVILAFSIFAGN